MGLGILTKNIYKFVQDQHRKRGTLHRVLYNVQHFLVILVTFQSCDSTMTCWYMSNLTIYSFKLTKRNWAELHPLTHRKFRAYSLPLVMTPYQNQQLWYLICRLIIDSLASGHDGCNKYPLVICVSMSMVWNYFHPIHRHWGLSMSMIYPQGNHNTDYVVLIICFGVDMSRTLYICIMCMYIFT